MEAVRHKVDPKTKITPPALQTHRQTVQLFCFPYAGGGTHLFSKWDQKFPSFIKVCPIGLPGRGDRISEPAFVDLRSLVDTLVPELLPHCRTPFVFFGHSMGALIAFETARSLREAVGVLPLGLFFSACPAPQAGVHKPPIHGLPDELFIEEIRRLQGIPEQALASKELMELMLPTLRNDITLCETYRYVDETPLPCPITVFGGRNDESTRHEDLLAWEQQTTGIFTLRSLPGDHFFFWQQLEHGLGAISADIQATKQSFNRTIVFSP